MSLKGGCTSIMGDEFDRRKACDITLEMQGNQPIRLPGLILRLRSGQAPGVCSGLILSGAFYPDLKIGVKSTVERIKVWREVSALCVNPVEKNVVMISTYLIPL